MNAEEFSRLRKGHRVGCNGNCRCTGLIKKVRRRYGTVTGKWQNGGSSGRTVTWTEPYQIEMIIDWKTGEPIRGGGR